MTVVVTVMMVVTMTVIIMMDDDVMNVVVSQFLVLIAQCSLPLSRLRCGLVKYILQDCDVPTLLNVIDCMCNEKLTLETSAHTQ